MEWIILIFSLVTAAILYYYKRDFFDEHKGYIEFAIIVFTALFAIYQVRSSAEDFEKIVSRMEGIIKSAEESKKSLKNVETDLSELPLKLSKFAEAIDSLNSVVTNQQAKLSNSLRGFNESMLTFRSTVEALNSRYSRTPDIKISLSSYDTDSSLVINRILLTNFGTLGAEIYTLRLHLLKNNLISFDLKGARKDQDLEKIVTYQADYENEYVFPKGKMKRLDSQIVLSNKKQNIVRVIVNYNAEFGNSGTIDTSFYFSSKDNIPAKRISH